MTALSRKGSDPSPTHLWPWIYNTFGPILIGRRSPPTMRPQVRVPRCAPGDDCGAAQLYKPWQRCSGATWLQAAPRHLKHTARCERWNDSVLNSYRKKEIIKSINKSLFYKNSMNVLLRTGYSGQLPHIFCGPCKQEVNPEAKKLLGECTWRGATQNNSIEWYFTCKGFQPYPAQTKRIRSQPGRRSQPGHVTVPPSGE